MSDKSILIIGAGVAGLCAGIYGQMNGYQTQIIEQHTIPGGLVTAFRRQGYLVDVCVHWLTGSGPGLHLHRYWNEVGLLAGRRFIPLDTYGVYHGRDGRVVSFYCDPERLKKHLLEVSPPDAAVIHDLIEGVRLGIRFRAPEKLQYEASRWEWTRTVLGLLPLLPGIQKWTKLTVGELAGRFQSQLIRDALNTIYGPEFSVFYMVLALLGFMYKGQAAYPVGGSLPLALDLEQRYRQLGGRVQYRTRVDKVLVEDGRAVGVRLEDGSDRRADVVISAGDGYTTIFQLLEGKYVDQTIRALYDHWKPFQSILFVSAGVNRTFPDVPLAVEGNAFELKQPMVIAGDTHNWLGVRVHNHDASFAPPGKTVLTSAILTEHAYWHALNGRPGAYAAQKDCVAQAYLAALEQIWPGISPQVEMINVATPLTFERITGNWHGSITGWKLVPEQVLATIPRTLPGLDNFWMVGQWVFPGGGLPAGISSAREVIWQQCRKDRKPFTTVTADKAIRYRRANDAPTPSSMP